MHIMARWICLFIFLLSGFSAFAGTLTVVIKKSARRLDVYSDNRLIKSYKIGLGLRPVGAKEIQGDKKTPEGTYYVCSRNPRSQFYLSLGLNYPNLTDAERGLRERLITAPQFDAIAKAQKTRTCPPANTRLGGEILIHGNGSGSDWTWGCVALDDKEMKELFALIPNGTPVEIKP